MTQKVSKLKFENGTYELKDSTARNELADIAIYARDFKDPSEADWGLAINRAINTISAGTVILPKGDIPYTTPIIQKSNITIKGQGIEATKLKPTGCHGITINLNEHLSYAVIKDLTISGDNGGINSFYDKNKHGINWNSGNKETYLCRVENVRIENMSGKGLYVPFDFSNRFEGVRVIKCGGNGIELNGFITDTLINCYVDYVATGYTGYRIYSRAHLISCNGLGGSGDYWGVFGRRNNLFVDTIANEINQYFIVFENCNIEDFKKVGLKFIYAGGFELRNTPFLAPKTGTFECYIEAENVDKFSIIDGLSSFLSKGSTMLSSHSIKSNIPQSSLISYNPLIDGFTVDGTTKVKIPVITTKYSYNNNTLSLNELHASNMSEVVIGGKKHITGLGAPTTGNWVIGDTVHNSQPLIGRHVGWICIASGSPGTWSAYGQIGVPVRYPSDPRPTSNLTNGYMIFDLTIGSAGAPIWWNGTKWVNASGEEV